MFPFLCAVCFGDPQSPLTQGATSGIIFLVVVIAAVLVGISAVAYSWHRRAKSLQP